MPSRDIHNNYDADNVVAAVAVGTTGTGQTGKIIDRQGYGGLEFVIGYGTITATAATLTVTLKEGDVTGTLTSVADADLLGTEVLASLPATTPRTSGTAQNVTKRIGYKGQKRYVQVNAVQTGVTSVGCVGITALLHNPANAPTTNP